MCLNFYESNDYERFQNYQEFQIFGITTSLISKLFKVSTDIIIILCKFEKLPLIGK